MASAFVGLSVKVHLTNGSSLKGHVANVDPITQRLMLQDVVIQYAEESDVKILPTFSVGGGEIKDLQVLPTQPAVHPAPQPSPTMSVTSTSTAATGSVQYPHQQQYQHPQPSHLHPMPHYQQQHHQPLQYQLEPGAHMHAPLVAPSPSQLPAHPYPATTSSVNNLPYHDPAIISFTHPDKLKKPQDEVEVLSEKLSSTKVNKQHSSLHIQNDHLTIAESSATESAPRGQRRSRRSTNNGNNNAGHSNYHHNNHHHHHHHHHHNNHYHNNNSDYGSPRAAQQVLGNKRSSRKYKEPVNEWATGDTEDFKDEDFDFQSNLDLFDKARVFAEIREADDTAPESLLVNLNRNPNRARALEESPMMKKLLPTENVLDPAPKKRPGFKRGGSNSSGANHRHHHKSGKEGLGSELSEEDEADDSDDEGSWISSNNSSSGDENEAGSPLQPMSGAVVAGKKSSTLALGLNGEGGNQSSSTSSIKRKTRGAVKIQTLTGVLCPTVTSSQMQEAEKLSALEMGLSESQMIENGGRGAAMMCLQALGGSRRIQPNNHNSAPIVVILAGNNRTGAYALCAGRHLSNHGCQVLAFVAGSNREDQLHASVAGQSRGFIASGGEMLHTITELPESSSSPVDLIMDGMLGYQFGIRDIVDAVERETVCDLMDWANDNKAPVLSLDLPSGVHGMTSPSSSSATKSKNGSRSASRGEGAGSGCGSGADTGKGCSNGSGSVGGSASAISNKANAAGKGGGADMSKFCIRPKWTLCLGAPKTGCRSRATTGELFLTDLGIPRACWKRAGVKGWGMPYGADFLVGLEYLS
ncbi:enhancer of mRNA decapping [Lunasporangiospora selenospora]|uniref:Enhancer of mRNA-decapping protein 3 n=1 Tax=Lunasporangiospora selenospora TaxID=979761 RepID=A0A9P6G1T0_9FUNG|nr:enhancer of mRNA decapping [Lunasporangiospora selenospora]